MPIEQPDLRSTFTTPGVPGTWWLDKRGAKPRMRRVPLPGEIGSYLAKGIVSSPETRVAP